MLSPSPDLLRAGEVIHGCYRIEQCIGRGGMGQVFAARDLDLDRRVAVKVMREAQDDGGDLARRFEREARLLSRIVHPNVVAVHAFGRLAGGSISPWSSSMAPRSATYSSSARGCR